jgi:predicted nucleic acid-binding protein
MAVAVVDSGVLIGMADSDDERHETARRIVRGIDRGDLPTGRVTNYVVIETLNWIHQRRDTEKARETYRRLKRSAGFEVIHAPKKDLGRALELFETHDGLSFGDATIAAYVEREDLEFLYSFDGDFDAIRGVTRLDTATNPYD